MRARVGVFGIVLCGVAAGASADAAEPAAHGIAGERPRGHYVPVSTDQIRLRQPGVEGGGQHILFLNRCTGGITITQGVDNSSTNTSSIVSGSINLPEYPFGDAAWNEVLDGTRDIFAPFGITVTDVDPGNTPHDEVIVCGSDNDAGFPGSAGVAPFTCGVIANVITYVFPATIGNDARFTIETVAQEAAHGWGLDHEFKCEDPMTYLLDCGDKSFQNGAYPCGEYEARACMCGGNDQNSFAIIMDLFGPGTPDTQAPSASIVMPADGQQFMPGDDFTITVSTADDGAVQSVALYLDGAFAGEDTTAPFEGWAASDVPEGTHELYVEATDAAGNVGLSDVVTIEVSLADQGMPGGAEESDGGTDDGIGTDDGDDGIDDGTDGGLPGAPGIDPGFGRGTGEPTGCACDVKQSRRTDVLGLALLGLALWVRRRARA
jgi:hypothetical protein